MEREDRKYENTKFPHRLHDWMLPREIIRYEEPFKRYNEQDKCIVRTHSYKPRLVAIFTTGELLTNDKEMRNDLSEMREYNQAQKRNKQEKR